MRVLPAIDLHDQMCVRLVKGDYATAHKVAEDAVETAKAFLQAGADFIHMVDLNGAKDGTHPNYPIVRRVIEQTGISVELGGGIRSMEDIERVLALGVKRVVIGSAAVKNPLLVKQACEKYSDKIAVGIDALHGTVRTEGWIKDSGMDYIEFAKLMESYGVKTIIFTDIDKDGMLSGPNFAQLQALRDAVTCGIVASGGVSTLEDITKLRDMGIEEAIAGKAVYTGQLDVRQAILTAAGEE